MRGGFWPLALGLLMVGATAYPMVLAREGQAVATVVLAKDATEAEATAAREVAEYLTKVTGGQFGVVGEEARAGGSPRVLVGPTQAAAAAGIDAAKLGAEEWIVRTVGGNLLLVGGRPRGTLYAAYHFLEDVVGVHWWNPWEESVPQAPTLTLGALNRRGQPFFRYRDIYMLYGYDEGRFAARNRLNRQGDAAMSSAYGGTLDYGPPYPVHTFESYFPPAQYFASHPEWYSLIDGKRLAERSQLCLTNAELRQAFLAKLRGFIETSWAEAKSRGLPPPLVFSVSQNDWANPCQCESCQAIAKAEGSEAGPLLDFVNFLADSIRDQYPEVFLDTLAYMYTQEPPKTIRPRDNVIIRLCDTEANMLQPITDPTNRHFRQVLLSWARIARNLRIWDYAVTYGSPNGMPLPTAHTFGPDYRFYGAHNVEGVFTELEYEILADMRDFKVWMMMKSLEDPRADYGTLVRTFMDGFYGPAGAYIRQYLTSLESESRRLGSRSNCWAGSPQQLSYLHLDFVLAAHRLFAQAERAVRDDPVLLRRVRHARLPLDRATLALTPSLVTAWMGRGGDPERFPLNRDAIARRALSTWEAEADFRLPEGRRAEEKMRAAGEIGRYTQLRAVMPLPEKFRDVPRQRLLDYTAIMTRNWDNIVKVVADPEAESGVTNRLLLRDEKPANVERYKLPMPWGLYDTISKVGFVGTPIDVQDVPGRGYHWYRMGRFKVRPGYYLYFFWSWIIQLDLDNAVDPRRPDQEFDIWARIKFEGPMFPHGREDEPDAIYVERVVLVRAE
ncbi:MAG: DUF4838 domain-containing protein [Armatimonadetes bacterium]|nr:DUF4838 domain-containing protein [Armatimonadota bacterium]